MEISHSKAACARGCWKKYWWKYEANIEPIKQSHALTIGKVIHEAFDLFYKGFSTEECHKHIENQFVQAMSEAEAIEQEDLHIAMMTTLGMWDFYPSKDLTEFEKVSSEVPFNVRLGNSRTRYVGRIDGHVVKNGLNWVREFKTTGLNQKQFTGRMRTSAQATGYVYASQRMNFPVAGVMFDVISKPRLRKRSDEKYEAFGKRIYEDYRWRSQEYYLRHYEYRTPDSLELFEKDMLDFARDLRNHRNKNQFYRNCEQCWNFNSECPYMKVCFAKVPDALTLQLLYKKGDNNVGRTKTGNGNAGNTANGGSDDDSAG